MDKIVDKINSNSNSTWKAEYNELFDKSSEDLKHLFGAKIEENNIFSSSDIKTYS